MRARYLILLLSLLPDLLLSQGLPEDDLYFPPQISVGVSTGLLTELRLINQVYKESVRENLEFTDRLHLTRYTSIHTDRLLPIIYFDQASYVISEDYRELRGDAVLTYREDETVSSTRGWPVVNKYADILNVIGYRMQKDPGFRIGLRGSWSCEPGENQSVARERAEVVKEYLQDVWRVESDRINLLEPVRMADSSDHVLHQQEARAVRLISNDADLFAPVTYRSIGAGSESVSLRIRVIPYIPIEEVRTARLRFILDDEVIRELDLGPPEIFDDRSITWYIGWKLPEQIDPSVRALSVQVLVEGRDGRVRASAIEALPIEWNETMQRVQRENATLQYDYLVMPFDAGDSTLSSDAEIALVNWLRAIASRLHEDRDRIEWIEVIGSGDLSEAEGIDPVKLETGLQIRQSQLELWSVIMAGPDLPVVYSTDVPERDDGFPDFDELEERAVRARLGERYVQATESKVLGEELHDLVGSDARSPGLNRDLESLALARARSVSDYLCIALDTTGIPVNVREDVSSRRYQSPPMNNSIIWDPVTRAYRRYVHIRFLMSERR